MRRLIVALVCLLSALAVAEPALAAPQPQPRSYGFSVEHYTPDVKYYDSFSYEWVKVSGSGAPGIRSGVHRFVSAMVVPFLHPDAGMARNAPWWFQHRVQLVQGCLAGYVCVQQGMAYGNQHMAGSATGVQARAWSLQTGRQASLGTFVSSSDLAAFTSRAKSAIKRSDCSHGVHIDLPPSYQSFPDWVPVNGGIRLWFPEYKFACQVTDVIVRW